MEGILAIILIFGGGAFVGVSFSPIGQAIADRMRFGRNYKHEREDPNAVRDAVASLQEQVSELAERQDFTERVVAQQRDKGALGAGQKEAES